ncbi:HAMP domain-containing histidine kinase [Tardiphaga sp. vice154]|uniref:sensor histidine kinase n=1 Tax=Tardiphaga sp. vice154 TaxID=2592814 RepID=UPI001162A2BD|nr:HAMP domain-containing sensor histidine kinase [Tardiphaga sp. vice154]MBC7577645.1 HAMP domain-containing histidine kinase [Tardiphaga sp.]QDM24154.1 HAMP domain-containing histidine kinase [Tardiphaga sp. vice154]
MTREDALNNLQASSAHVRGQAARILGDVGRRGDLPRLHKAQREETVTYVNYALQETIRRLAHEQAPEPSTDKADIVSDDVRKQIYGKAMEWITGFLLHEISSPIGLVRLAAKRELGESWDGSGTQRHLESVARVFDAIERLKNAASVPRPQEFDLSALVDELLDVYSPEVREWISTIGSRPFVIKSDPSLVRMVVVNGIRNAVEAQQAASAQPNPHDLTISWGDTDVDYWLAVVDHGGGIKGPIETAFEIGNSTKRNHIGFGLAIARQAVETMIGSLSLAPAKHGGALYTARWRK